MKSAIKNLNQKKPIEGECFAWHPVKAWDEKDYSRYCWVWLERVKYKYMSELRLTYLYYMLDSK